MSDKGVNDNGPPWRIKITAQQIRDAIAAGLSKGKPGQNLVIYVPTQVQMYERPQQDDIPDYIKRKVRRMIEKAAKRKINW